MKLMLETEVYGEVLLKEPIVLKNHPYIVKLIPLNGVLEKVSIERVIVVYENFLPRIETSDDGQPTLHFPKDDFLREDIELLQHLESFGSLDLGLTKINWENPKIVWIAENPSEEAKIRMPSYRRSLVYQKQKLAVTAQWLQSVIIHRKQLSHLVAPLSFYRKGINHYHKFNNSEAFLHFYLILEGLFGNGNTRNQLVEKAFNTSEIMLSAVSETFDWINNNSDKSHRLWLESYLAKKSWKYDVSNIIKLLVDMRGNLSHYSVKSTRNQRDNLNEREYQTIAFVAMSICTFASIKLRFQPLRRGNPGI